VSELPLSEAIIWAERRSASAAAPDQLAAAVALAEELRDLSEELIGRFVARAREADSSWLTSAPRSASAAKRLTSASPRRLGRRPPRGPSASPRRAGGDGAGRHRDASLPPPVLGTEHVLLGLLAAATASRPSRSRVWASASASCATRSPSSSATATRQTVSATDRPATQAGARARPCEAKHSNHRYARSEHLLIAIAASDGVLRPDVVNFR